MTRRGRPAGFIAAHVPAGRMTAHGRSADVRHLDFPDCGQVVVRPWPPGQAPAMPFDNGGTAEALDAAHDVALPAVARQPAERADAPVDTWVRARRMPGVG